MSEALVLPLRELVSPVSRPVAVLDLNEVRYAGVRWYAAGVYERESVPAAKVKGSRLSTLRVDDVVYNRMWASKASFGVAGPEVDGCHVTNDFPTFRAVPDMALPGFIGLVFETDAFQSEASARATGTTERRRLKEPDFLAIPVPAPTLDVQRRIVDLVGALDANIAALQAETSDLAIALEAALDLSFPDAAGARPLGDLVTARSGPSWAASDETSEPVTGATPVVKITNTRPDGSFDTNQLAYVRGLRPSTTTLNPSSIVVIRTNGNRARIGNAYLPPEAVFGSAV